MPCRTNKARVLRFDWLTLDRPHLFGSATGENCLIAMCHGFFFCQAGLAVRPRIALDVLLKVQRGVNARQQVLPTAMLELPSALKHYRPDKFS